ncbi:hypothetical protein J41TS2_38320 [Bacillus sonorensis]|nr:hypothetical protein J41TS2_38320 [Bacillus sonorensis]
MFSHIIKNKIPLQNTKIEVVKNNKYSVRCIVFPTTLLFKSEDIEYKGTISEKKSVLKGNDITANNKLTNSPGLTLKETFKK